MLKSNASTSTLRRLLQQELSLAKQMIAFGAAESAAIVAGDVPRLTNLTDEQSRVLAEQGALEKLRLTVTRELAWKFGIERRATLSALLPALTAHDQEALRGLRLELLEAQTAMQRLNARNAHLLDNALDFVQFAIGALTTTALQPARYGTNLAHIVAPAFYIDSKA